MVCIALTAHATPLLQPLQLVLQVIILAIMLICVWLYLWLLFRPFLKHTRLGGHEQCYVNFAEALGL